MNTKLLVSQVKRELWEHKGGFIYAPMIVAGLVLLLLLVAAVCSHRIIAANDDWGLNFSEMNDGHVDMSTGIHFFDPANNPTDPAANLKKFDPVVLQDQPGMFGVPMQAAIAINSLLASIIYAVVLLIYTHGTLFDDRKSRDILFWRSMPVSERVNVLVKLGISLFLAPSVIFLLNLVVAVFALVLTLSMVFVLEGVSVFDMVSSVLQSGAFVFPLKIFSSMLAMNLLLVPVFSYFMFCSAFAKKSPLFLSSLLPVGLLCVNYLVGRISGVNLQIGDVWRTYCETVLKLSHVIFSESSLATFIASQWQVVILVFPVAALWLAATIWLRNHRYEI